MCSSAIAAVLSTALLAAPIHSAPQPVVQTPVAIQHAAAPPAPAPAPAADPAPAPAPADPRAPEGPQEPGEVAPADAPMAPVAPVAPEIKDIPAVVAPVPAPVYQARPPRKPLSPLERDIRKQRRTGIGLMAAGWPIFFVGYLITSFSGAAAIDCANDSTCQSDDLDQDRKPTEKYGQRLLIPVVGPFMAAGEATTATQGYGVAFSGIFQLAGLAMGITGAVLFAKAKKRASQLSFSATPTLGGARASFGLKF